MEAILRDENLEHLLPSLVRRDVRELQSLLAANRVAFLAELKALGVAKVGERQKLANAFGRAVKAGRLDAQAPTPHMRPCTWTQTHDGLTVRLRVPGGTLASRLAVRLEPKSVEVRLGDERTAATGRFVALIRPDESTWELERAAPPEPEPYAAAPPPADDAVVFTLAKARPGDWPNLFEGGEGTNAVREAAPAKAAPRALSTPAPPAAPSKALGVAMKPHKLRFGESVRVSGRRVSDVAPTAPTGPSAPAAEHWQGERAWLLWRDGAPELRDEPAAAPPPEGALFRWRESATEVVVTARTRRGLPDGAVELRAAPTSADVLVDGAATPWCGMLCGRVEPARCRVAVVAGAAADDHDTLELTLVKAERRLWRAPWRELIADVDAREAARRLPRREAIMCGEWHHAQSATAWTVVVPIKTSLVAVDDMRVAVAADSLSLYVAGQEDAPLLAGELHGRLDPARCSWTVAARAALVPGAAAAGDDDGAREIEITLRKATAADWPDLIKTWYV